MRSRTVVARSGRDGHALWKTVLDPPWRWVWPEPGRSYRVAVFSPLPAGDLDGDGTSDILVEKFIPNEAMVGRQPAALPLQLLSGRDGRHRWAAGPLPLGFEAHGFSQVAWLEPRVIEPNAPPDLLVLHRSPFVKSTGVAAAAYARPARDFPQFLGSTEAELLAWLRRSSLDVPVDHAPAREARAARPPSPAIAGNDARAVELIRSSRTGRDRHDGKRPSPRPSRTLCSWLCLRPSCPGDYREVVITCRNVEGLRTGKVAARWAGRRAVRMLWARAIERLSLAMGLMNAVETKRGELFFRQG